MLTDRRHADLSKYEILGILLDKGLPLRAIAKTCGMSNGWAHRMLERLGYEYIPGHWRKRRPARPTR